MTTTYTPNLGLQKPARSDRNWDSPVSANFNVIDAMAPIGGLSVATAEFPSASLNVRIAAGTFRGADGTIGTYAGTSSHAITASSTLRLWLDSSGTLQSGASYPTTAHLRLGTVVSGATTLTSVTDDRVTCSMSGTGLAWVLKAGDTMTGLLTVSAGGITVSGGSVSLSDGVNVALGTSSGSKIGTANTQKIGFYGATPIVRPPAYTQTYSTADRTLGAYTPNSQGTAYTGQDNTQSGTVYGKVADLNTLRIAVENLRAFVEDAVQLLNSVVDDHQSLGIAS